MEKVLIVEDSADYQKIISRSLSNYKTVVADSSETAAEAVYREAFDLIILDIRLPGSNGYSFLSDLQSDAKTKEIPVICVTGNGEIADKTTAFSLGADDYLVKPFDPIELKARVDSKLTKIRKRRELDPVINIGKIKIDKILHKVFITESQNVEEEVDVTQTEFKILCHLARRVGQVYTRDQLLVGVWGENANVLDRVIDVHVCSLRKKLKSLASYIRAIPSVGYAISLQDQTKVA